MNAADKANSVEIVSKIAAVVNLFKSQFPEASVDLSPWIKNAETAKFDDPDSIDLAFHFPRYGFTSPSQMILMQIRLPERAQVDPHRACCGADRFASGVEISGHNYVGQQWQFTTTGRKFWGISLPLPDAEAKLKHICQQILQLFDLVREGAMES